MSTLNMSIGNDTPSAFQFPNPFSPFEDIVYSVLYQISGAFALIGNLFVMWVIIRNKTLHTPSYILLFNLAFIDHLTGIVLIASSSLYSVGRLVEFQEVVKGVGSCLIVSLFNLFFIGLDRFLTLTFPLKYMNINEKTKLGLLLAAIWVLGVVAAIAVYVPKAVSIDCPGMMPDKLTGVMTVEIILGGATILTVLIHTRVYFIAAKQARRIAESQAENSQQSTINIKAVKTTMIVLSAFLVCYFPSLLYLYSTYDCSPFGGQNAATVSCVVYFISFSGCTVNPVIYTLRRAEFKRQIIKILNVCGLCIRQEDAHGEMTMTSKTCPDTTALVERA